MIHNCFQKIRKSLTSFKLETFLFFWMIGKNFKRYWLVSRRHSFTYLITFFAKSPKRKTTLKRKRDKNGQMRRSKKKLVSLNLTQKRTPLSMLVKQLRTLNTKIPKLNLKINRVQIISLKLIRSWNQLGYLDHLCIVCHLFVNNNDDTYIPKKEKNYDKRKRKLLDLILTF